MRALFRKAREMMTEATSFDLRADQIMPNPNQPRKFFDERAHRELMETIKENGLLQPVVVRVVDGEEVPHMIVAGERRWRACTALGLPTIPARVINDISEEKAYVLSIAENVGREDMTIMEEAGAYADLVSLGWKPEAIAKTFGKTKTHIEWRLGLLTLRPEVAEWVNEGKIKPNLSWHIAQLSPAHQMVAATRYLRGDFDSEADAANFAQGLRMAEQQTSLVSEKAPTVEEKEKRQKQKAKTQDQLGKVEEVVMPLLDGLTDKKPDELATILGGELGRYVRAIDRLVNQATLARRILRQAKGISDGREVAWNEAVADVERKDGAEETANAGSAAAPKAKPTAPARKTAAKPTTPVRKTAAKPTAPAKKAAAAPTPAKSAAPAKKIAAKSATKEGTGRADEAGRQPATADAAAAA